MPTIMNIMGGFEALLNFSVCGFASTGQEWVKNQHGVGSDWGFTKSNTARQILRSPLCDSIYGRMPRIWTL